MLALFIICGEGDLLFFGGGGDIFDLFGSGGEPDSSDSSSLSESDEDDEEEDDDDSFFFLATTLGAGDRSFWTGLSLVTSRVFGDGSESEELSSSDSDFGTSFFLGLTGGGDTEAGECCLFFGDGDDDGDALCLR